MFFNTAACYSFITSTEDGCKEGIRRWWGENRSKAEQAWKQGIQKQARPDGERKKKKMKKQTNNERKAGKKIKKEQ